MFIGVDVVPPPKLRFSLLWKMPGGNPQIFDVICSLTPCDLCGEVVSEIIHFGQASPENSNGPSEEQVETELYKRYGSLMMKFMQHRAERHGGKQ